MGEIDWDDILDDAIDSPRALLSEVLARADEIGNIVIVFHDHDGRARYFQNTSSTYHTIAMLEFAKWSEMQNAYHRSHPPREY